SQGDQFRFRRPVENPRPRGVGIVLAPQRRLEPLLNQVLTSAGDSVDARVQRRRDRAVAPSFAGLRHIGLQEDARPRQQLRRTLARTNQRFKALALRSRGSMVTISTEPSGESPGTKITIEVRR